MHAVSLGEWQGCTAEELACRWELPAVHLFQQVGSTNDVARSLGERGAPSGTLVLADEQLSGRGRIGRPWASPAGQGVWLSLVVRPHARTAPGLLPLTTGLAAAEALDRFVGEQNVMIKWPNDLLLGGRKLGGVLCEAVWDRNGPAFVVIGIGVNVRHTADHFPTALRDVATSLRRHTGLAPALADVAGTLASAVHRAAMHASNCLSAETLEALSARDVLKGQEVLVSNTPQGAFGGEAVGIAPDGALLVRTPSGTLHAVQSGSVRTANSALYV